MSLDFDIATFAVLVSIIGGIVAVWTALRAAKNEAQKAAKDLEELRLHRFEKINDTLTELIRRIDVIEERIHAISRCFDRIEREHEKGKYD